MRVFVPETGLYTYPDLVVVAANHSFRTMFLTRF